MHIFSQSFPNSVASDACTSMRQYNDDPATSRLAELMPCLPREYAEDTLIGARSAIKAIINHTNNVIDEVNNKEQEIANERNETQPRVTLEHVCDPYGPPPEYEDLNCTTASNDFRNFTQVCFVRECFAPPDIVLIISDMLIDN